MVRDFASLGEAKKRSSVYVKAVSLLCAGHRRPWCCSS